MKILIVDDDAVSRRVLREMLGTEPGQQITEAVDGEEAWAFLDDPSRYFDLVFLDVAMPKSDGFELLGRIRQSPILRTLRIVMCTGTTDKLTVGKLIQLGARHFIAKPANVALVQAKLRQMQAEMAAEHSGRRQGAAA